MRGPLRAPMGDVVVVGSANVDLVVDVARHPRAGETVLGGDLRRSPGGKGANQAVAAARAGGARTSFLGALGNDDGADLVLDSLKRAGVRTDLVQRSAAMTGTALISVSADGENTIIVAPGANGDVTVDDAARARLAEAGVVLAQLEIPLAVVLEVARARRPGAVLALNAAPSRELPAELWDALDVLLVNEHEARDLTGAGTQEAALRALLERVPAVVITLGAAGCLVAERGRDVVPVRAPRVVPVDTTGAGDTFCGVLAAALAAGEPLARAARRGAVAGALAVTRPGAQDAVPTVAETAALARASRPAAAAPGHGAAALGSTV